MNKLSTLFLASFLCLLTLYSNAGGNLSKEDSDNKVQRAALKKFKKTMENEVWFM